MDSLALKAGGQAFNAPQNLPQPGNAPTIFSNAITIFLIAGIFAALIAVIWAGIQLASSAGDKEKIAAARRRLIWGIVGLLIMLFAIGIINIIGNLFGVDNLLNFAP